MANLTETNRWEAGIYQLETSDPVMGGPNGIDNRPTRELANRTLWLKNEIAKAVQSIGENKTAADQAIALKANAATLFTAGAGLTGGGSLAANRSFALATPSTLSGSTTNWAGNGATGHTHELAKATPTTAGVVKLVDNLIAGGVDAALSAEQGKVLAERISAFNSIVPSNRKRRIISNLPSKFPEHDKAFGEIRTETDTYIYPQQITIADGLVYVLFQTNASYRYVIAVYDYATLSARSSYRGYYLIKDNAAHPREGIVVKDNKIYVSIGQKIVAYNIGTYGSALTKNAEYAVDMAYQFDFDRVAKEWYVEKSVARGNNLISRQFVEVYDEDLRVRKRSLQLPLSMCGYPILNKSYTKRQSLAVRGGVIACGMGAFWAKGGEVTPNTYQGVAAYISGQVYSNLYRPDLLAVKYDQAQKLTSRTENEGVAFDDDGRIITLTMIQPTNNGSGGMLFAEEWASEDYEDYADCAVMPTTSVEQISTVFSPIANYINPLTGEEITNLYDLCVYMTESALSSQVLYLPRGRSLTISDDYTIPEYSYIQIINGGGDEYHVTVHNETNRLNQCPAAFIYRLNGSITKALSAIPDSLWFQKGTGSVPNHRSYSEAPDGTWYNWLDIQHRSDNSHYLYLGGSAAAYYGVDAIRFSTNKGDGGAGVYTHWEISNQGVLRPYGSNKSIGASDMPVQQIHAANNMGLSERSTRVPTTKWVGDLIAQEAVKHADFNWAKVQPGTVAYFVGDAAPHGWLAANGAAVGRASFPDLFRIIGTRFGAGDGVNTFNLPDLRGEFVRGWDAGRGVDLNRVLGSSQNDEFRSHSHTYRRPHISNDVDWEYFEARRDSGATLYDGDGRFDDGGDRVTTAHAGGVETRPRNVALLACIKV